MKQALGAKGSPGGEILHDGINVALGESEIVGARLGGSVQDGVPEFGEINLARVVNVKGGKGGGQLVGLAEMGIWGGEDVEEAGEVEGGRGVWGEEGGEGAGRGVHA